MFVLFNMIFALAAVILGKLLWTILGPGPYGLIYLLYWFAVFIPHLAVLIRRLHDIGKGGGWIFIVFIPLVGIIWLLVLLCTDSEQGENRFGANPKA